MLEWIPILVVTIDRPTHFFVVVDAVQRPDGRVWKQHEPPTHEPRTRHGSLDHVNRTRLGHQYGIDFRIFHRSWPSTGTTAPPTRRASAGYSVATGKRHQRHFPRPAQSETPTSDILGLSGRSGNCCLGYGESSPIGPTSRLRPSGSVDAAAQVSDPQTPRTAPPTDPIMQFQHHVAARSQWPGACCSLSIVLLRDLMMYLIFLVI